MTEEERPEPVDVGQPVRCAERIFRIGAYVSLALLIVSFFLSVVANVAAWEVTRNPLLHQGAYYNEKPRVHLMHQ